MKINRNGFTLIEVIVSISLLLLLALLVVPGLVDIADSSKDRTYDAKIELALSGAYKYGKENVDELNSSCKEITIGELINLDYISGDDKLKENLIDPLSGGSMNDIVICVSYVNNEVSVSVK